MRDGTGGLQHNLPVQRTIGACLPPARWRHRIARQHQRSRHRSAGRRHIRRARSCSTRLHLRDPRIHIRTRRRLHRDTRGQHPGSRSLPASLASRLIGTTPVLLACCAIVQVQHRCVVTPIRRRPDIRRQCQRQHAVGPKNHRRIARSNRLSRRRRKGRPAHHDRSARRRSRPPGTPCPGSSLSPLAPPLRSTRPATQSSPSPVSIPVLMNPRIAPRFVVCSHPHKIHPNRGLAARRCAPHFSAATIASGTPRKATMESSTNSARRL